MLRAARTVTLRSLIAPAVSTGLSMALYLTLRPYGDSGPNAQDAATMASAFADPRWLIAHLSGMSAIASFAWLTITTHDQIPTRTSRAARALAVVGAALALPYYGAETFALHELGDAGAEATNALAEPIRNNPVALTTFGVGLAALAAGGIAWASAMRHPLGNASWPLGIAAALLLPQFHLPTAGRVIYGVAYAAAAILVGVTAARGRRFRRGS